MSAFLDCVEHIFRHEAGFINHPKDPGGATNMGITRATLSAWRGEQASVADVRNLTRLEARQIYMALYWNPVRGDQLPRGLDLSVFDMAVNAGPRRSIMLLQRALRDNALEIDGAIGPMTLAAVTRRSPRALIEEFYDLRMEYYRSLSTWATFGKGWKNRAVDVLENSRAMAGYRVRA